MSRRHNVYVKLLFERIDTQFVFKIVAKRAFTVDIVCEIKDDQCWRNLYVIWLKLNYISEKRLNGDLPGYQTALKISRNRFGLIYVRV